MRPHPLALFAALHAAWSDVHPLCDQVVQRDVDAVGKSKPGREGRRHCLSHVASYTAVQIVVAFAVPAVLGYRVPPAAVPTGAAINAVTHYAIDRRTGFVGLLRKFRKASYLDHATVQRRDGVIDQAGPGTALMEMDQAAHRVIGVLASAVTTVIAVRCGGPR